MMPRSAPDHERKWPVQSSEMNMSPETAPDLRLMISCQTGINVGF
jgi:hypothetical protein